MPLTRRALILSAAAAGLMAPLALGRSGTGPRTPLPAGIWRSRTTADLLVFESRACRTYTRYDDALALVDESSLEDIEQETREARLTTTATWSWNTGEPSPASSTTRRTAGRKLRAWRTATG